MSYSNAVKQDLLGVTPDLIARDGAVSSDVARAMASGALDRFPGADLTVAVTGIAGPAGGSAEKPVGLTYVAAGVRDGPTVVERHVWTHDRDGNKRASALACLEVAARLAEDH